MVDGGISGMVYTARPLFVFMFSTFCQVYELKLNYIFPVWRFHPNLVLPVTGARTDQVERVLKSHFQEAQKLKKELELLIVILPDIMARYMLCNHLQYFDSNIFYGPVLLLNVCVVCPWFCLQSHFCVMVYVSLIAVFEYSWRRSKENLWDRPWNSFTVLLDKTSLQDEHAISSECGFKD